ncbi:MAG: DUF4869 domain-containing protein [Clostridiales bacterium]|nr:DUF4869 domain-containing protein [Clostridiales bacterium]
MLNIYLGEMEDAIYHPPVYFDNQYEDEWLLDDLSRMMIADVDKSEVVGPHLIESSVLGPISPASLSGGVKTLILMAFDDSHIFNASACGDNCAKWILKIADNKELKINLLHLMNFGDRAFEIKILNNGKTVHNMQEFAEEAIYYV